MTMLRKMGYIALVYWFIFDATYSSVLFARENLRSPCRPPDKGL